MRMLKKPIDDKLIRGIIAGIIAGLLKVIPAFVLEYLCRNPHPTFWDYMSLLSIGRMPNSWEEYLFAIIVEVSWCTFLAIGFVYLRPAMKSKHYMIQGAGLGIFIWLMIRAIVYFFQAPELIHSRPLTALMNITISVFYGVAVAIIDRQLESPKNAK